MINLAFLTNVFFKKGNRADLFPSAHLSRRHVLFEQSSREKMQHGFGLARDYFFQELEVSVTIIIYNLLLALEEKVEWELVADSRNLGAK